MHAGLCRVGSLAAERRTTVDWRCLARHRSATQTPTAFLQRSSHSCKHSCSPPDVPADVLYCRRPSRGGQPSISLLDLIYKAVINTCDTVFSMRVTVMPSESLPLTVRPMLSKAFIAIAKFSLCAACCFKNFYYCVEHAKDLRALRVVAN